MVISSPFPLPGLPCLVALLADHRHGLTDRACYPKTRNFDELAQIGPQNDKPPLDRFWQGVYNEHVIMYGVTMSNQKLAKRITVSVSEAFHHEVKLEATKEGKSVSDVVKTLLQAWLDERATKPKE